MSAYITFYIRSRSGGPYIELESFSRNSCIYRHINDNVQYGTTRLLKMDDLREAIDSMAADIIYCKKHLAECQATIDFLQGVKEMDYNERMDHYQSLKIDMQELRENIDELQDSKDHLRTYMGILGTHQWVGEDYAAAADLYISHEDDPNYQEEKETE